MGALIGMLVAGCMIGYHFGARRRREKLADYLTNDDAPLPAVINWPPCPACGKVHNDDATKMFEAIRGGRTAHCRCCKADLVPTLKTSPLGRALQRRLARVQARADEAAAFEAAMKEQVTETARPTESLEAAASIPAPSVRVGETD